MIKDGKSMLREMLDGKAMKALYQEGGTYEAPGANFSGPCMRFLSCS